MMIVIQCAARKRADAGYLTTRNGERVFFVADPDKAPKNASVTYAHPDEASDTGEPWRKRLMRYNETPGNNPLGLLPAWQLYENETYALLVKKYGADRLFILSAGWGLLSADFLTPLYDITFSAQAEPYKRRRRGSRYEDFRMLPSETDEPVVFFVGKAYIPLACALTADVRGPRHLFYSSQTAPDARGCNLIRYETRTRTNWHYECAKAFMDGRIAI